MSNRFVPQTLLLCSFFAFAFHPVQAQITPDNTLGTEASKLTPDVQLRGASNDIINGGAQRGNNLFHSFTEFNINDGQRVYFANPVGVLNILTRVTGGQASNLNGTLGVDGAANLFLINPNGIIFGKNASLDVQGSFVGTTAEGIKFADGNFFNASNNQSTPLLTVSVPIGLQMGANPSNVNIQGNGHNLTYDPFTFGTIPGDVQGLKVPTGKTLALVGGNIILEAGNLRAEAGRIELGSVASPGLVNLAVNDSGLTFGYSGIENFGDILLSQKASVDASGEGGGSIQVQSRRLSVKDGSSILSITSGAKPGGDFAVNATELVELIGQSTDAKYASSLLTESQGSGASGNLTITTPKLTTTDGAYVSTYITSSGNGGNLTIKASDWIQLSGIGIFESGLYTGASAGSSGDAGKLKVETRNLEVKNSATVFASSGGQGKGGDIFIQAPDQFFVSDARIVSLASAVSGNMDIKSGSLLLIDGASLITSAVGTGDAGHIFVEASDNISLVNGFMLSGVGTGAIGKGGDINITAGSLSLSDSSQLLANIAGAQGNLPGGGGNGGNVNINVRGNITFANSKPRFINGIVTSVGEGAVGNGGKVTINADSLVIKGGSEIQASTSGKGDSSSIKINVRSLSLNSKEDDFPSRIVNDVRFTGEGNAGGIDIKTDTLTATNGAYISSSTAGKGNAGNITVEANDAIKLDGTGSFKPNGTVLNSISSISSQLLAGEGKGGDILLTTGSLSVTNGAQIASDTNGRGNAGNITINARDTVTFTGFASEQLLFASQVSSSVSSNAVGNSGNISISGSTLLFENGGSVQAISGGVGNAGNIFLDGKNSITIDGVSSIGFASNASTYASASGNGGNIQIVTGSLFLISGGKVSSDILGKGNAGNITIDARDVVIDGNIVTLIGSANSAITSSLLNNAEGKGGEIQITTDTLKVTNGGLISSATNNKGSAGNITINARDTVTFDGAGSNDFSSAISAAGSNAIGNAGDIRINARALSLANGAKLSSDTFGKGDAGNITINTKGDISIKNASLVSTRTFGQGSAGSVKVTAGGTFLIDGVVSNGNVSGIATIVAKTPEFTITGKGGDIDVNARTLSINNKGGLFSSTYGKGDSGNITINLIDNLNLDNNSQIDTATYGQGAAGNIFVEAGNSLRLANSSLITSTVGIGSVGKGGDIDVNTKTLTLESGSQILTTVSRESNIPGGIGKAGNLRINAFDSVTLSGSGLLGFSSGLFTLTERGASGDAGNITVTTGNFRVTDGAVAAASTFNDSKGGEITINANTFEAINGGQVITNTRGAGNAGNIRLNVKDSITIAGSDKNFDARQARIAESINSSTDRVSDVIVNEGTTSGIFANTTVGSTGLGGSIFIDPRFINIKDEGKISVNSAGTGNAGNISIIGGSLKLDNGASISAQTASSQGGNIDLQLSNLLLLRRGSQISTTAGTAQAGGDGGNININTPFIVAVPDEKSNISANAFTGKGGNINIRAQGIIGIEARNSASPTETSSITASSERGVQGQISITKPDVEPEQGLIELPTQLVDVSNQIGQMCPRGAYANRPLGEFTVTGRGSLPPNPLDFLPGTTSATKLATLDSSNTSNISNNKYTIHQQNTIVEAQGLVKNTDGSVELVAMAPDFTPSARSVISTCR
ncbi:MAG: filamentous hemagglutinin N-terminal domain-containing protein [Calothrix sp. C42_A2020_038]|nr:filamentous hemagglutinin N-terminal domain-containing protein [Calothrix sp. C42_A2020_038]